MRVRVRVRVVCVRKYVCPCMFDGEERGGEGLSLGSTPAAAVAFVRGRSQVEQSNK